VHGDSLQSFIVAIIVPDFENIKTWLQHQNLNLKDTDQICQSKEVYKLVMDSINLLAV